MKNFDFETLEMAQDIEARELYPFEAERSDLMSDCADVRSECAVGKPGAQGIAEELIDLAANIVDFGSDLTAIARSLAGTVSHGRESGTDVHDVAGELYGLVQCLVDLTSHSSDAAETLITLARALLEEN